jgi:hypothetical protein
MATFDAQIVRAVAIELSERVIDFYLAYLPIYTQITSWTLNGTDPMLPSPFEVKAQIDAYKAIKQKMLKLDEWVSMLQQATVDDTLSYPPPPISEASGYFDGSGTFDGTQTFDGEG